jgi:Amt family ammonium transporter
LDMPLPTEVLTHPRRVSLAILDFSSLACQLDPSSLVGSSSLLSLPLLPQVSFHGAIQSPNKFSIYSSTVCAHWCPSLLPSVVAGTVAERCKFEAYLAYSLMLTGFVYPVVVYSIWSSSGFVSAFNGDPFLGCGMHDFAGSGVVHMTGGVTALIAAKILGPRIGRFYDADGNPLPEPVSFAPHSVSLQVLGTFILWVGVSYAFTFCNNDVILLITSLIALLFTQKWYGFNPGSTLMISNSGSAAVCALAAVTTTIAAASGSVSALFTDMFLSRMKTGECEYDITMCMNGALGGLVAITAGW